MKIEIDFQVTEAAIEALKKSKMDDTECFLRIFTQGNCSGMRYSLNFVSKEDYDYNKDILEDFNGLNIITNKKSALFLDKIKLDYIGDNFNKKFEFLNSDIEQVCGCSKKKESKCL